MLKKVATTLELARMALKEGKKLAAMASSLAGSATEDYAKALKEKRVLTPVDHPDPAHCIITGTGLTIWARPRRATASTRSFRAPRRS
jgi:hypothetical protein